MINESRRGLNVARNAGVRAARAERIAICDADDVVDGTWLEHLCAKLDDADLVGGGLAFDRLNDDTVLALRGWDEGVGPSPSVGRELGHLAQIIGANMAFRIGVWTAIGGFDEGLTRGGDDVDFAWRAQMSEYTLASCPEAVVHYRGRASKRALFHQYVRDGHGAAHLFKLHRQSGMPRRPVLLAMKSILAVVAKVPWLPLLDTRRQGHVVRAAGKQWGRVLGSLNHRVVYL